MIVVKMDRLKTGEIACQIEYMAYALVETMNATIIKEAYNPSRKSLDELEAKNFNRIGGELGKNADFNDFVKHTNKLQKHIDQQKELGRESKSASTSTFWGKAQQVTKYASGINSYSTSSHGGFKLSANKNQIVPDYMRNDNGYYEEDCEWSIIATVFPEFFTDLEKENAKKTLIDYYPNGYEKFYSLELSEGQSYKRDKEIFQERNKGKYVVTSAIRSDVFPGMVDTYASRLGEPITQDSEVRRFLVPAEEYSKRGQFSFVIDLDKHQEIAEENISNEQDSGSFKM